MSSHLGLSGRVPQGTISRNTAEPTISSTDAEQDRTQASGGTDNRVGSLVQADDPTRAHGRNPDANAGADVDVVILTWNDGPLLGAAVRSALQSEGVGVAVTVVDNGSDLPLDLPDDPRIRVLRNADNRGVAAGRNQGIRWGSAPWVCILDSDACLEPRSLASMIAAAADDAAIVGPVFAGQRPEESAGRSPTLGLKVRRVLGLTDTYAAGPGARPNEGLTAATETTGASAPSDPPDGPRDVDFVIGACQLVRRVAWQTIGGIDERYFYGPEDIDFCLRMREAGWRIQQVPVSVEHPPRRRNRNVFTRRGVRHAGAVARHLWRHRRFRSTVRQVAPTTRLSDNLSVDVHVVTYGDTSMVPALAADVAARLDLPGRLIVVDHSPDRGAAHIASAGTDAALTWISDPSNPGFGAGHNRAAEMGSAPLILLLNPDAAMDWEAVRCGIEVLRADPGCAAVQGRITTRSTGAAERAGGRELGPLDLWGRAVGAGRLLGKPRVVAGVRALGVMSHQTDRSATHDRLVESFAATALLIRRDAFEAVGGFDASYFLYGEDLDLCRRLRADGWRLVELAVPWAVHDCGASAGAEGWAARERFWWTGTMRFVGRWWTLPDAAGAAGAALLMAARLRVAGQRVEVRTLVADPVLVAARRRVRDLAGAASATARWFR